MFRASAMGCSEESSNIVALADIWHVLHYNMNHFVYVGWRTNP